MTIQSSRTLDSLDGRIILALDKDPEASALALSRTLGVAMVKVVARGTADLYRITNQVLAIDGIPADQRSMPRRHASSAQPRRAPESWRMRLKRWTLP